MAFNFGSTPKTATGFTLPTAAPATTASTGGFQFGSGDNKLNTNLFGAPASSGASLSFGLGQTKTSAPTLSFGTPTTQASTTAPTLSLGTPAPTTTSSSFQLSFGNTTSTAASTAAAGSVSFTPILASSTTTTATALPSFGLSTSTATPKPAAVATPTTVATTVSLGTTTATTKPTTTATPHLGSALPASGTLTFSQLEDSINKWTIDLEEQGKFFINQAKQLNAWDSLLISNGEKILNLNGSIERVKQQQSQLDQELDFILSQQKELEELIRPLEKELADIPVTDIDRNQMYQFAEVIDSQLKQMSDDLKEIIENINESHRDEEASNPIIQIGKILNAHMNSLHWVDRNTAQISAQLEEISKIEEANRRNLNNSQFM